MKPFLRNLGRGLRQRAGSPAFRSTALLMLGFGMTATTQSIMAPVATAASAQNAPANAEKALPPWEQHPKDMRAAYAENKQALQLISAVFAARLRRGEVEFKFKPTIAAPNGRDPLSGPNDLAVSPLLQDFGQGAVWLSVILTADKSQLSPRLQEVQQALLEGLKQSPTVKAGEVKKQIRKPARSKDLEDSDTARDIQLVLQAERNYQEVVSQLRAVFPKYAELYVDQSPRVLNRPGVPTVFELCDPVISFDPLEKNERMQASLMVKVYRYEEHSFKIVSFWLYRNIEDPDIFVPRALYSEKGKDVTRNYLGRWDETHMPPRTFSSVAYVSQAVTVVTLKFIDGEPVISGRSVRAGRRQAQPVDLATLDLNELNPASEGVLDVSVPTFPITVPDIPSMPALALKNPQLGRDYMPRIRESYEFRSQAEYEGYLSGIREVLSAQQQAREIAAANSSKEAAPTKATVDTTREAPAVMTSRAASTVVAPVAVQQLNVIYLDPNQPNGLNELSALARDSLKQYPDLRPVTSRNLVNELVAKSNASLHTRDRTAELLREKILKVREVNVYFLASENTTASWRGPDDSTGKGGIVIILPNRYYFDPQQFYRNAAGGLINQPVTAEEVATVSNYLGGASAQQGVAVRQFAIETDYVDHGWDEDGAMRRWADEAVDFFKHLEEAIVYLKPRLDTMAPDKRALLESEVSAVEAWVSSLGDASVTINFGLYKGKNEAPAPKVDMGTRTILISCTADEYIKSKQKENRWTLLAKIIGGFNGLHGGKFDPGITGAIYDILTAYATDKDNKLMIARRLNTDLPNKPADWPVLAATCRVPVTGTASVQPPQAESRAVMVASATPVAGSGEPVADYPAEQATSQQVQKNITETAPAPAQPPVAASANDSPVPQLRERQTKPSQPVSNSGAQWADPVFGKQVSGLISSHMIGVDESSLRGIVLRTMTERLIVVREPNPSFHSRISALDMKEPSPKHFDFSVNKSVYFDLLFELAGRDEKADDVIWSTFEANAATVEYAAGNRDFGPMYAAMQSSLNAIVKRHTQGVAVSQDIFDDPQFKVLLPYYTAFWSNWQFAAERARFQYLRDRVTSKRVRHLASEAAKSEDMKSVKLDLLRLADELDLFYGERVAVPTAIPATESNAGLGPGDSDMATVRRLWDEQDTTERPKPYGRPYFDFDQVLTMVQRVQQPEGQRLHYQDSYRMAFTIYQLLEAWNRLDPDKKEKAVNGEWTGTDLRFILPVLAEIHAKKLGSQLDRSAIVTISGDMPWVGDTRFDLTQGAFNKLPDTLKLQP